jgi:DNA-binding XRE family transcriptional regulator
MSAVVKTRHINKVRFHFHFKKSTPRKVLTEISNRYSAYFTDDPGRDNELVDISSTDWFNTLEKEMKPEDYLKHLRDAHGLTQKALGVKVGVNAAHISDYETGQRAISKEMARKFALIFKASPGIFI